MSRRLALASLAALALAPAPGPAWATNTTDEEPLVVALYDGKKHEGEVSFLKDKADIKGRKRTKVRYKDIASLADAPPPGDAERAAWAADLAKRKAALEADAAATAEGWAKLGRWAADRELRDEARAAFEKAVALDPERDDARKGLGQLKADDGAWVDAEKIIGPKRLAAQGNDALVEVARFALQHDQREAAFDILRQVLNKDTYHAAGIELSTPFTKAYRQKQPLAWMLRGRWKASEDRTRHHQRKAWARYALDLFKVDAQGKAYTGDGRKLTDHFGYGAPFYAVADGVVAEVRDGFPDNEINAKLDDVLEKHNGVTLDHGNGEFSWYVHAKAGTFTVKVGDKVKKGQLLGQIGNSGASGTPHLHFTLVTWGNLSVPWACDDYTLIAPDGTPIPVTRACPREGWTIESKEPE